MYAAIQCVEELADGLYHYDARAHQLELLHSTVLQPSLAMITLGQDMVQNANLVIIITAVLQRTMWKYGQRGYRYILLDAGHLGQNLYLVATALGLGAVAIGAFFDDELNHLLRLPAEEKAVYLVCIGQSTHR
jgi:SagB-type dehydrogenase family enzyme